MIAFDAIGQLSQFQPAKHSGSEDEIPTSEIESKTLGSVEREVRYPIVDMAQAHLRPYLK